MSRKILLAVAGTAIMVAAGMARAEQRPERSEIRKIPVAAPGAPRANDGWEFVGGDTGWQLKQHSYDRVNGQWLHTDTISHNAPRPTLVARPDGLLHADSGA